MEALIGVEQNPKYHREGDAWPHTMLVLDEAAKRREEVSWPLTFLLSALTHDFGKAVCSQVVNGEIHAYEHETLGLPLVEAFMTRLTGEKALIRYVLNMVGLHMKPNRMVRQSSVKAMNRLFDQSVAPRDLILLASGDDLGSLTDYGRESRESVLLERLAVFEEYMSRLCVMGADLVAAGLKSGPEFHALLELAHKLRLAGVEKEIALRQVLSAAGKQ